MRSLLLPEDEGLRPKSPVAEGHSFFGREVHLRRPGWIDWGSVGSGNASSRYGILLAGLLTRENEVKLRSWERGLADFESEGRGSTPSGRALQLNRPRKEEPARGCAVRTTCNVGSDPSRRNRH